MQQSLKSLLMLFFSLIQAAHKNASTGHLTEGAVGENDQDIVVDTEKILKDTRKVSKSYLTSKPMDEARRYSASKILKPGNPEEERKKTTEDVRGRVEIVE
jgi:hypothetical protein